MAHQDEIELKLDVTPASAAMMEASPLLTGIAAHDHTHHAVYFDTPDQALRAAGLSLRIRRTDGRRIQTLKVAGAAAVGLFARREWEREAIGDWPTIDESMPLHTLIGGFDPARLAPVFEVRVERRLRNLQFGDAAIELAIDHGTVVAAGRSEDFCEVELELKEGAPAALFGFARALAGIAPARCGILSKAERGYRLVARLNESAVRAQAVPLTPDMTSAEGFEAIAAACLRQFRLNEILVRTRRDPAALHQARVALRRLRSAISMFRAMLNDDRRDTMAERLRSVGDGMALARAIDVLIDTTADEALRHQLARHRMAAYDAAIAILNGPACASLMLDLAEWIAIGPWRTAPVDADLCDVRLPDAAAAALDRFRRRIKQAGPLNERDDEERHRVRIAAKRLRYATEYFGPLFKSRKAAKRHAAISDALEILQERLGRLNDIATIPELFRQIGMDGAQPPIDPAERETLIIEAAAACAAVLDAKRFWR
ncbi:CYTH and CHAD domain-containing protein [Sphingomonas sp. KC8]|uniref:CYTH and CHAD domain-containing protein n=1 Tax=Sphingomonas sp. KC8 TaxID=1030157 RepID=UPI00024885DC|nr:CYTH and CHAD domain-containing protein [Sphingomonas sp. KC8]ARS27551.1 ceramide glucosyltransferase [Sphingomonas sp. KC8]